MKRFDLVQLSIIITGICSAFFFVELLPTFLVYIFTWFSEGLSGGYMLDGLIRTILFMAIYLLFSVLSISNSKQLASWISNKANLGTDINFAIRGRDLLFALLIVLGMYGLIRDLPALLSDVYQYFKETPHTLIEPGNLKPSGDRLFIQLAKVAFSFVTLVYANVFSEFFSRKLKNYDPVPDDPGQHSL